MKVEISDLIIEAIKETPIDEEQEFDVKFEVNTILWQWIIKLLPSGRHSRIHKLDIEELCRH